MRGSFGGLSYLCTKGFNLFFWHYEKTLEQKYCRLHGFALFYTHSCRDPGELPGMEFFLQAVAIRDLYTRSDSRIVCALPFGDVFKTVLVNLGKHTKPVQNPRCRIASNVSTAVETDTLSESILPLIGILICASECWSQKLVKPFASVPITIADGSLKSLS